MVSTRLVGRRSSTRTCTECLAALGAAKEGLELLQVGRHDAAAGRRAGQTDSGEAADESRLELISLREREPRRGDEQQRDLHQHDEWQQRRERYGNDLRAVKLLCRTDSHCG